MKTALITGITGQDGSYLAELLIEKGYRVYGMVRRSSTFATERIEHIYREPHMSENQLFLEYGDLADSSSLRHLLSKVEPDEVYNLAAQSHVRVSFDQAEYTADITGIGALRLLESIRDYEKQSGKSVRVYQASSSEMFGAAAPLKMKRQLFIRVAPMVVRRCLPTGKRSTIANHMVCMRVMVFCLIMRVKDEVRTS